jgi:hypothetical protein
MVHQARFAPAPRPHAGPQVEHQGNGGSQQEQSRDAGLDPQDRPVVEGLAPFLEAGRLQEGGRFC